MRLRLLKLCCLFLVLALAGGLVLFNFAGDDLQSAFIQTSAITPASPPERSAAAPLPPVDAAPGEAAVAPAAPNDAAVTPPDAAEAPATADATTQADTAAPSAAPATDLGNADEPAKPAQAAQAPAASAAAEGRPTPPAHPGSAGSATASAPVAAAETPPASSRSASSVGAFASGSYSVRASIPPARKRSAAPVPESAGESQPAPASAAHPAGSSSAAPAAASEHAAGDDAAAYQIASSAAPPSGPPKLVAQTKPPPSAPLVPSETRDPRAASPLAASQVALGPETLIEFPSLQSTASGSLAGAGSVTNSSARIIPGIIGSWTSAPLPLPFGPSVGGSLFIGMPASGDSVASAATSGGYTLKLGQTNMWPVIMPRLFMGVPVGDSTSASFGTGVWINNIKETATLANASSTQTDEHSGMIVRPFLNAAIMQRAPLFDFVAPDAQKIKLSGGYVFGDSSFQAGFCASGQTCVKTSDQGSWFLGLSYEFGFPVGGAAPR